MPAFRLLHTSDWHLGALFHDYARDDEEQRSIDAVIELARREAVDAVVIAGDIFDSVNPPATAQARYYRMLLRLKREAGVGCVLVIGGNHDHGLRLDGPRDVLAAVGAQVRGQLIREQPAADAVVPITGRSGEVVGWAALLPYLREADLATVPPGASSAVIAERQAAALTDRLTAVRTALFSQANGLPMIAVAHVFAAGGTLGGTERPVYGEDVVGRLSRADVSPLATGCSYVALGHLHRPQSVAGHAHWRYCGSLLPMAMDETTVARQVLIADIPSDGGPAQVRAVPLPVVRRYARLSGDLPTVCAGITALMPPPAVVDQTDQEKEPELEPWCDVVVDLPSNDPSIVRDLAARVADRGWRALAIRRQARTSVPELGSSAAAPDLRQWTPTEVFAAVVRTQGHEPTEELYADFAVLMAHVSQSESGSSSEPQL